MEKECTRRGRKNEPISLLIELSGLFLSRQFNVLIWQKKDDETRNPPRLPPSLGQQLIGGPLDFPPVDGVFNRQRLEEVLIRKLEQGWPVDLLAPS